MTTYPQKILVTHQGRDVQVEMKDAVTDVVLRENKGSNGSLNLLGAEIVYDIGVGDIVRIYHKKFGVYKQYFGGYVESIEPAVSYREGLIRPVKLFGFDIGLDRMRAAIDYGTESMHPTIDTLTEILTDANYGLIPKFTQQVLAPLMGTTISSGYTFNTTKIYNETTSHKYIPFPYTPINDCLKTLMDLICAARYPSAGLHWSVIPVETTSYLCIDVIGAHTTSLPLWPTFCPVDVTRGLNMSSESWSVLPLESNFVIYLGLFEKPTGEVWTEGNAAQWESHTYDAEEYVAVSNDSVNPKVGAQCIKMSIDPIATQTGRTCGFRHALSVDFTKIWGRTAVPTFDFYFYVGASTDTHRLCLFKDWDNYIYLAPENLTQDKWIKCNIKATDNWVMVGSCGWEDVAYIGYTFRNNNLDGGAVNSYVDELLVHGTMIRAAYHSGSIASNKKCRMKLITDSLAKQESLTASDDSGTVAQLAKAELLRAMTTPTVGSIPLARLEPTIWPGQIISFTPNLRITEVHHHCECTGASTALQVTTDVLNGNPAEPADNRSPTSFYNSIMKAVNPDFQNRDMASLKARDIDIDLPILAKDYA